MILGMSVSTFTSVHVGLSLVAIASGIFALLGTPGSRKAAGLTALFLLTTTVTSVTGFFFLALSTRVGMGHVIGVVSLIVLVPTMLALYCYRLVGPWRLIYVTGATIALYLNAFIGVFQAFGKVAFLHPFAPTPSAPPLLAAQFVVLAIVAALGALAVRRFYRARSLAPAQTARGSRSPRRSARLPGGFAGARRAWSRAGARIRPRSGRGCAGGS